MSHGQPTMSPSGKMGPGGASTSMIKLGGALDLPKGPGDQQAFAKPTASGVDKLAKEQEKRRLEQLMKDLNEAIAKSQAMAPYKDQLLLDITSEGLRIQIVDKQNRPMFDTGSGALKSYTVQILHELAGFVNQVPNPISISGHTDSAPYIRADSSYGNWELSADRANAARRTLVEGGMQVDKVARVVGLAASVPFDKADPSAAINRRISIVVMTREAARAALSSDVVSKPTWPSCPTCTRPSRHTCVLAYRMRRRRRQPRRWVARCRSRRVARPAVESSPKHAYGRPYGAPGKYPVRAAVTLPNA